MIDIDSTARYAADTGASGCAPEAVQAALKFITCGSVDDGKSTLIGRLLVDSRAVLQDHLAGVQRGGETDLALLTDGLSAEREQGITIDVAWRYFASERRKFIIGDAPGHEQYTRNMVTAASGADAAVVLVDASKLDWRQPLPALLAQTRRHALLAQLLRVPSLVFAVNKLDAVADPAAAWLHIRAALADFARAAGICVRASVPLSALHGWNLVDPRPGWCGYHGPTLLQLLETLPSTPADSALPLALPVQWVEKPGAAAAASAGPAAAHGRRIFWGRVAAGSVAAGTRVQLFPGGQTASVARLLDHARRPVQRVGAPASAGIVLDRELDISRGDWLLAAAPASDSAVAADGFGDAPAAPWAPRRELRATVAWLDEEPLVAGRVYWALHGHRWVKARVRAVLDTLDIATLVRQPASALGANAIGHVDLLLHEPLPLAPFSRARVAGALILVDCASHRTAGAVLVD